MNSRIWKWSYVLKAKRAIKIKQNTPLTSQSLRIFILCLSLLLLIKLSPPLNPWFIKLSFMTTNNIRRSWNTYFMNNHLAMFIIHSWQMHFWEYIPTSKCYLQKYFLRISCFIVYWEKFYRRRENWKYKLYSNNSTKM